MTEPTQAAPRQTTKVIQAVRDAHGQPSTVPRYLVGSALFLVGLGLFVNHVLEHHGTEGATEFRAILGCGIAGLLILPGIAESMTAGIKGVGGALVSLKKQKDAP
jgi:hypothetical protein